MSAVGAAKLERYRQKLYEESTEEATVSLWRKRHAPLDAFTRGATGAILEATEWHPGMPVDDLAEGFAKLRKVSDGSIITMSLEIVVGSGLRA